MNYLDTSVIHFRELLGRIVWNSSSEYWWKLPEAQRNLEEKT